jgi:hypothetical protein
MPRDDVISPVGRQIVPAPDLPRPISLASHICYRAISSVRESSGTIGAIDICACKLTRSGIRIDVILPNRR